MALTIIQQPVSPQYSYSDLVYVVSSDLVGPSILPDDLPVEHSFVIDIYDGTDRIGRFRKQANPNGDCIMELSRILDNQLQYDLGVLGASSDTVSGDSSRLFSVRFGEEFQTNSLLQVHSGETGDPVAEPGVSADALFVIKGFQEFNVGDFDTANLQPGLISNVIGTRIHRDDTLSISELQETPSVVVHHNVDIPSTGASVTETVDGVDYTFEIYDDVGFLGESRFAWFNRTGGIDYFTFDQEEVKEVSTTKRKRNRTIIDYAGSSSSNKEGQNARVFRGATTTYGETFQTTIMKNSRWLNDSESDAVSGIFDSPAVYLQDGTSWIPIDVLSSNYTVRTISRQVENFQYVLEYRLANDKRGY